MSRTASLVSHLENPAIIFVENSGPANVISRRDSDATLQSPAIVSELQVTMIGSELSKKPKTNDMEVLHDPEKRLDKGKVQILSSDNPTFYKELVSHNFVSIPLLISPLTYLTP